jgi:hypothetical protein
MRDIRHLKGEPGRLTRGWPRGDKSAGLAEVAWPQFTRIINCKMLSEYEIIHTLSALA